MTPESLEVLEADLRVIADCVANPDGNQAWQAFVDQFGSTIRYWIRQNLRTASHQDHEDVYQNVLYKLLKARALNDFDPSAGKPRPWLWRVVKNASLQLHRTRSAVSHREVKLADELAELADRSERRQRRELLATIAEYLAGMNVADSTLRIYNDLLDGFTPAEVAEMHHLSLSTVYRHREDVILHGRLALGVQEQEDRKKSAL